MTFAGYKMFDTDTGEEYIVNCNDTEVNGIKPAELIKQYYGGCPIFEFDNFTSGDINKLIENMSVCRKNGDKLYVIPLEMANRDNPIEEYEKYYVGKIIKAYDYTPRKSDEGIHNDVNTFIYLDLERRAGEFAVKSMQLAKLEEELRVAGLLPLVPFAMMDISAKK